MIVHFGPKCPRGDLPVFSVADEEEARALLVSACGTTLSGQFFARELVVEQTLDNLSLFSARLAEHHDGLKATGRCRCAT